MAATAAPAARLGWAQVIAWRAGLLSPVLLVEGRMEGVWRQEVKGRRVPVTIEPFAGPPPAWARRAAEDEAERLAAVAGGPLELRWAD